MPLSLTLKPGERLVINGCAIRNTDRRHVLTIESQADVIRGKDLLEPDAAATPVSKAYFLIQTVLISAETREKLLPLIQRDLAILATVFGSGHVHHIFEAANHVSSGNYYAALAELRPVLQYEKKLLETAVIRASTEREALGKAS